jgi:hypothetical protein
MKTIEIKQLHNYKKKNTLHNTTLHFCLFVAFLSLFRMNSSIRCSVTALENFSKTDSGKLFTETVFASSLIQTMFTYQL